MICYRDRSFCANQEECKTEDCGLRLTEKDKYRAKSLGLPVAWMPFKEQCSKFQEKK